MQSTVIHQSDSASSCEFAQNQAPAQQPSARPQPSSGTLTFANPPYIAGRMSIAGEKEGQGPIGQYIRHIERDPKMGESNYEQAEIKLLEHSIRGAIGSAGMSINDCQLVISGDLLNQMTSSSYVARNLGIPHLGLYSACSTMTESLAVGAMLLNAGYYQTVVCAAVSHFATAERQFRFPLEYGAQRPPYSQWTVTGSGATVLSATGRGVRLTRATLGRVVDFGTTDISNMGAAMAPAAADTLSRFLRDTGTSAKDYDLILTGDLGKLGSDIMRQLCRETGIELAQNYTDCGVIIYDAHQHCYQGGSGCGCSSIVVNSFVLDKMESGEYHKVLYLATGALMSPQSCYQGETIPCISHAVLLEV